MKKRVAIIVLLVIAICLGVHYHFSHHKPNQSQNKVVKNIAGYDKYRLTDNKTKLYKKYFNQLHDVLTKDEVDEEAYAKLVAKMFVADFYDLKSKYSKNDIGGTVFIHPDALDNFKLNAGNTMYKYVEQKIVGKRTQELPVIKTTKIDNIEQVELDVNKTKHDGYIVELHWQYEADMGYQKQAKLEIIKAKKYLYIIKID